MQYAILARETTAVLLATRAPSAGDHGGGAENPDMNIRCDKTGVFCRGSLNRGDKRAAVPSFPGWSRADIIIAIDTLKKAGIVQGHRMSGFLLQNYDFLRSGLKFRGDGSLSFLLVLT